jgi:hypothetical protein
MFRVCISMIIFALFCASTEGVYHPCDNTTSASCTDPFPSCTLLVMPKSRLETRNDTELAERCVDELKYVEKFVAKAEEIKSRLDAHKNSPLQTIDLRPLAAKVFFEQLYLRHTGILLPTHRTLDLELDLRRIVNGFIFTHRYSLLTGGTQHLYVDKKFIPVLWVIQKELDMHGYYARWKLQQGLEPLLEVSFYANQFWDF